MNLFLKRIGSNDQSTFGVLLNGTVPFAVTLELAWRDNRPDISCIPNGQYICRWITSPKFGQTFEVMNVKGRENILFHCGNTPPDTHGCLIVGESFEVINGIPGVTSSRKAFDEFMKITEGQDQFMLWITKC